MDKLFSVATKAAESNFIQKVLWIKAPTDLINDCFIVLVIVIFLLFSWFFLFMSKGKGKKCG